MTHPMVPISFMRNNISINNKNSVTHLKNDLNFESTTTKFFHVSVWFMPSNRVNSRQMKCCNLVINSKIKFYTYEMRIHTKRCWLNENIKIFLIPSYRFQSDRRLQHMVPLLLTPTLSRTIGWRCLGHPYDHTCHPFHIHSRFWSFIMLSIASCRGASMMVGCLFQL